LVFGKFFKYKHILFTLDLAEWETILFLFLKYSVFDCKKINSVSICQLRWNVNALALKDRPALPNELSNAHQSEIKSMPQLG